MFTVIKCDKCRNGLEEIEKDVYDYCRKCNGGGFINKNKNNDEQLCE